MKKRFLFGVMIILLSSCGVTLESVVDNNLTKKYDNPALILPYEEYETLNFSAALKKHLEETFSADKQKVAILLYELPSKTNLELNSNDGIDERIFNVINQINSDLVIIFEPIKLQFYNGRLESASYQLVGIDIETEREVWKANFKSTGSLGASIFAKKSAQKIYQKLKADGILK